MTDEERWVQEVYQGPDRQLTVRAALTGMGLGAVLCLSNLYVVLKTGWSLGVTITATIVAYGLFRALRLGGFSRTPFSALENNAVASVASSGAWMTGGGNMAALPALLLLTGQRPGGLVMVAWFALIAALGVFVAIPLKRQFINREKLPFPMSVATAEAIRTMHGTGDARPARLLVQAGLVASLFTLWRDVRGPFSFPWRLAAPFSLSGHPAAAWSLGFDSSLVLLGGGSLMAPRTAASMLLGALLTWGVLAPWVVASGFVSSVDFKALVQFMLWPAAALLVTSGVLSFVLRWRSLLDALSSLRAVLRPGATPAASAVDAVEAPAWWAVAGFVVLAPPLVLLMWWQFDIPLWAGALAMPLALLVGAIAARVTGETDITPTKAMGPLTQLVFGVALPGHVAANVMSANVTSGVGLHAADLLSDLKTGWVLGADPRQQVYAQFLGLVVGAVVVVPAFTLLIPDASVLGSEQFPAPAVMVWAGVSKVLAGGLGGLPRGAVGAMFAAAALGMVLSVLEALLPARRKAWLPSPSALGISMVIPAATALTMVAGAVGGAVLRRRWSTATLTPVASGLIAGESVTGVALALGRVLLGG